jgi:hypothetical protein
VLATLTAGLVEDRVRRTAAVLALLAAVAGVAALTGRAVWLGERDPLLVVVRLMAPGLLALGGHLTARRVDERGPVLLVALALLLVPGLVGDLRLLSRVGDVHPTAVGGLVQSGLAVAAGVVAWTRWHAVPRSASTSSRLGATARAVLIGAGVLVALAELYPSVTGPLVGPLQPLVAVLGAAAWTTVVAALGVTLVVVVVARAAPPAASLTVLALAVTTLAQVALQVQDVAAGRVSATLWLWLELLAALALGGVAVRLGALTRRGP